MLEGKKGLVAQAVESRRLDRLGGHAVGSGREQAHVTERGRALHPYRLGGRHAVGGQLDGAGAHKPEFARRRAGLKKEVARLEQAQGAAREELLGFVDGQTGGEPAVGQDVFMLGHRVASWGAEESAGVRAGSGGLSRH